MHTYISHDELLFIATCIVYLFVSIPTAMHVLLYKSNERAAIGWIGLVFLSPILGSLIYWIFGVNRVSTHAKLTKLQKKKSSFLTNKSLGLEIDLPDKWLGLMKSGHAIHEAAYLPGNRIEPLINGENAYPRMLKAIEQARHDIFLCSYIFEYDSVGKEFITALMKARQRGVKVYVLLDGLLLGYKWRKVEKELRRAHIYTARFFSSHIRFFNLRNHRKILCIDGETAFIGGMNIARDNLVKEVSLAKAVQDIHFEVSGPVIDQISQAFADDWYFASDIPLKVTPWAGEAEGPVVARFLPDGPDEHYKKLEWTLLAAINNAERNIRIITPYFIPNNVTLNALHMAVLRGVEIELLIPQKVDIHALNWVIASNHQKILDLGIKIYLTPPPFEHSKLCMVDDIWAFIGSSNWDERSFSLNFEANLECYDTDLSRQLVAIFEQKKRSAKELLKEDCQIHSLPIRLRNNFFRLFSPYL